MDDWAACDAEAVVTALSVRYRFSRANAVQMLRDQGILPQREAAVEEEDDADGVDADEWDQDDEGDGWEEEGDGEHAPADIDFPEDDMQDEDPVEVDEDPPGAV